MYEQLERGDRMVDHEIEIQDIDNTRRKVTFRTVGKLSGFKLKDNVAYYDTSVEDILIRAFANERIVLVHFDVDDKITKIHEIREKTTEVQKMKDFDLEPYRELSKARKRERPSDEIPKETEETIIKSVKR